MVAVGRRPSIGVALASLVLVAAGSLGLPRAALANLPFTVDSQLDAIDATSADDICATADGKCTLRAAVMQANATAGADTINLKAGTYTLTIPGRNEYESKTGDLNVDDSLTIVGAGSGSTIIQASAGGSGSGIDRLFYVRNAGVHLSISGVTIRRGNSLGASGGGISLAQSDLTLTLTNVVMNDNRNDGNSGPAISGSNDTITITGSRITNNHGGGAPIQTGAGAVTIRTTTISGNVTTGYGAISIQGGGTLLLDRSTISGNTAPIVGAIAFGADDGETTKVTIRNSTISGNTVTNTGGAIIRGRSTTPLVIESSTIAGNSGIGISANEAVATTRNSIISGNTKNCASTSSIQSKGHNLESGTGCGFHGSGDIQGQNPKLGTLGSNGGSTSTRALLSGSPAIDAGLNCPTVDQRGVSRPKDGNSDGTAVCDMGAYEAAAGTSPAPTPTPGGTPTASESASPEPSLAASPAASEAAASEGPSPGASPSSAAATAAPVSPAPTAEPSTPAGTSDTGVPWFLVVLILLAVIVGAAIPLLLSRRRPRTGPPPA